MSTTSINQWLPCTSTKHKIGHHLAHVSLEHFKGKAVSVVEMCDPDYQPTESHQGTLSRGGRYTRSSARHSEHSSYMRRTSGLLGLALLTLYWDKNWDSHSLVNGYPSFYPRIALGAPSPDRHKRSNSSIHGLGWSRQKDLKTWRLDSLISIDENDQILDTFGHFEEGSISTSTVDVRYACTCLFDIVMHHVTYWIHIYYYCDVTMGAMAFQNTSLAIVYSTVYSDADQRKHQSSASLAFVRGIHRWPANSPHKWPVTRKMFPFDDVIMRRQKGVLR